MTTDPTTAADAPATGSPPPRRVPVVPLLIVAFALVGAIILAVSAEWTDEDTRSAERGLPDLQRDLEAHDWLLDTDDSSLGGAPASEVTLAVEDDRVFGTGPCNTYEGRIEVDDDGNTVAIDELVTTDQACDEVLMDLETEFFAALGAVRDAELIGGYTPDRLVLTGPAEERLSFTPIAAADRAETDDRP